MTQDEIIEMARQAGFVIHTHKPSLITVENEETWVCVNKELEAFAKLVAAKEREACAKVCDNKQYVHPYHDLGTLIRARGKA
jgi:hypothetical protein